MDPWYLKNLACPRDHSVLQHEDGELVCPRGHFYPVVDGVPVMLLDDAKQTLGVADESLRLAKSGGAGDPLFLDSVGISAEEKAGVRAHAAGGGEAGMTVDPVVSHLIGATSGIAYRHLIGKLREYPIPRLPLPPGEGRTLLDIGCNWGRWCIAASRLNYRPIGLDPSLGAVMAARRVANQLGAEARFVVGDARFLPFAAGTMDAVFSYSVLQHLSRQDVSQTVGEIWRVLKEGGTSLVQMPNKLGVRCLYHQARRRFKEAAGFEVRYWTLPQLRRLFSEIGPTCIEVDCFFGIGLQRSDLRLMPPAHQAAILASECLRAASRALPALRYAADSLLVRSIRRSGAEGGKKIDVQNSPFVK
jgi:ubiquinone/menaquinone biosynthesis C-methylase UbiE/uncharacterized protein YbaR (Trm112 family)